MSGLISGNSETIESRDQLTAYFESGCRTPDQWRIGTEHEKFLYRRDTKEPIAYDDADKGGIKQLLEILADRHAWTLVKEGDMPIGVTKGKYSINVETGGQIELSGAPLPDIHLAARELHIYLDEVRKICSEFNIGIMGIGLHPKWREDQLKFVERPRYAAMFADPETAEQKRWGLLTCAAQANLDFGSEEDMRNKLRVALALQPIVTAVFANSPFYAGKPAENLSQRYAFIQRAVQTPQIQMIKTAFSRGFGFENYADFVMQQPVRLVVQDGNYFAPKSGTFADFMQGRLPDAEGLLPTMADFQAHLSTIHTDVRMRNYFEVRGADAGQWRMLIALPALWTGLLYDSVALDQALQLIKGWTPKDMMYLRQGVAKSALKAKFGIFKDVGHIANEMLKIARIGLRNRARKNDFGEDETIYLDRMLAFIATDKSPAEHLLESYHDIWGQDIDRVIDECSF